MRRDRRWRWAACCGAALMLLGCSRSPLTTGQAAALDAAEARWKRGGPRDYVFEFRPFNGLAFDGSAALVEVRGGAVKAVTPLGSRPPASMTIDALFRAIRDAASSGNFARIEAAYDGSLGYPTRILFIATPHISDGNSIIEVRAFKDLTRP